ncbi:2-dehydropantoate 2-reductase [Palaeococcus ferrophilus]|uniref:2-dehydropantoate 2-reductase n=1 Tax=Palaeococcus ferrophilus TaxID=83868 RepID=UPI00064F39B3|nr:2-dehydropantoate 2-reductase [Palaeococcus ferrophilus]
MKVYVLGAGSIGSLFGGLLARSGHDVTLIGREEHVRAVRERGLHITGVEDFVVHPKAETVAPREEPDLLILSTKSYSTEAALECAGEILGENTWVLSIQNGLGNEELAMRYTRNVLGGITTNGAALEEWGRVRWTGKGITIVGPYPRGMNDFTRSLVRALREAGLEAQASENIEGWKWAKALVNAAINPVGALLGVKNGFLKNDERLLSELIEVVREGCEVARQRGVDFEVHPIELLLDTLERTRDNYNSMLQDIRRGRRTEIDYINGKIVEYAEELMLSAPRNSLLLAIVKALEGR